MGFRSYLFTDEPGYNVVVPQWFLDKYPSLIAVNEKDGKPTFPVVSKFETKFYAAFNEEHRLRDLQRILQDADDPEGDELSLCVVLLHECGGISKIRITPTSIMGNEPDGWRDEDHVTHNYCYECSEPEKIALQPQPVVVSN